MTNREQLDHGGTTPRCSCRALTLAGQSDKHVCVRQEGPGGDKKQTKISIIDLQARLKIVVE